MLIHAAHKALLSEAEVVDEQNYATELANAGVYKVEVVVGENGYTSDYKLGGTFTSIVTVVEDELNADATLVFEYDDEVTTGVTVPYTPDGINAGSGEAIKAFILGVEEQPTLTYTFTDADGNA